MSRFSSSDHTRRSWREHTFLGGPRHVAGIDVDTERLDGLLTAVQLFLRRRRAGQPCDMRLTGAWRDLYAACTALFHQCGAVAALKVPRSAKIVCKTAGSRLFARCKHRLVRQPRIVSPVGSGVWHTTRPPTSAGAAPPAPKPSPDMLPDVHRRQPTECGRELFAGRPMGRRGAEHERRHGRQQLPLRLDHGERDDTRVSGAWPSRVPHAGGVPDRRPGTGK